MATMVGDLLARFAVPFETIGLPYMVTGGAAAIVYGEPRLTNDLDIVVDMAPKDAARMIAALAAEETYVPPLEVIEVECARSVHGHFNVIHSPTSLRADVYLAGTDPLNLWGLSRRRRLSVGGLAIAIAPPEFVIIKKLQYAEMGGGDRHLRDIRRILDRGLAPIDLAEIQRAIALYGLQSMWSRVEGYSEPR